MAYKAYNIYCLALYRKSLPDPVFIFIVIHPINVCDQKVDFSF